MIPALDAKSIYAVPLQYHPEGLDAEVLRAFGIDDAPAPDLARWDDIMDRLDNPEGEVTIGVVGKYVGLPDAYKSLNEALVHGGIANRVKVNIRWLDAELFEQDEADVAAQLEPMHGILVPGGFGERGSEGKIASVRFARERNVPFFGICLGMQMACIEARAEHRRASQTPSTTEFGETDEPVVGLITEWMSEEGLQKREAGGDLGGTMRLGAYPGEARRQQRRPHRSTAPTRSASATATATRSTPTTRTRWRRAGWSSPACRPTACCPRSSSGPTIPGSSASSSTRS